MDVAEQRVEIRLRRIVKPTAGAYCLLLRRAELAVKDLDVEIASYVEDSPDEEEPPNLTYGASLVWLGASWVRGKQIVLKLEGEDAEEAAEKMRARLDREPPLIPVHDWLRGQAELSRRMRW